MPVRLDHITPNQFGYQKTEDRRQMTEVVRPKSAKDFCDATAREKPLLQISKTGTKPKAQGENPKLAGPEKS